MEPAQVRVVEFAGSRSAESGLTWGQRWIWDEVVSFAPDHQHLSIPQSLDVPPGRGIDDVLTAIRELLERYEALRTMYGPGPDGEPGQRVAARGQIEVGLYETGEDTVEATCDQVAGRMMAASFLASDLPLRVSLITREGCPARLVLVFYHMAVDASSVRGIVAELRTTLISREPAELPPGSIHPVDLCRWEGGAEGKAANEAALEYWKAQLQAFPADMLPRSGASRGGGGPTSPRFVEFAMTSEAMAAAVRALATGYRVSQPAVVLALVARLLAARAGHDTCGLTVYCANRFIRRPVAGGTLVQDVPVHLDMPGGDLPALLRQAWIASMRAYGFARYDPTAIGAIAREIDPGRGRCPDLSCTVNLDFLPAGTADPGPDGGRAPITAESLAALAETTRTEAVAEFSRDREHRRFYLVAHGRPGTMRIHLRADTSVLPPDEIRSFLAALEQAAVGAVPAGRRP